MIVSAFWHGPPLNAFHWACLRSFLKYGHTVELYRFEPLEAPEGVVQKDASEILAREDLFFFENPATGQPDVSPFSDLFRYQLLFAKGGLYVDLDTICLTADLPGSDYVWAQESALLFPNRASTGILAMPKGSDLARSAVELCRARIHVYAAREALGASLFSELVNERQLPLNMGAESRTFYPIYWIEIFKLALPEFADEVYRAIEGAAVISAYQSLFRYCGIDLAVTPPEGSYLRRLYETFAPDRKSEAEYSPEDIRSRVRAYLEGNGWAIPELISVAGRQTAERLGIALPPP